jgi:hypothetical protein
MRRILYILLFAILPLISDAQNQIWKAVRTSVNGFPDVGIQDGALDDGNLIWYNDSLHYMGGTDNSSVFQVHYVSGDEGRTWVVNPVPPWGARNAAGIAAHDGYIYYWGGNNYSGGLNDSWRYSSAGGWELIDSDMGTIWDSRKSFTYVWNGEEYIGIGGESHVSVVYSTDLQNWSIRLASLPANMQTVTGATACYFRGAIYWTSGRSAGGTYPSVVMKSTDGGATWTQIASDAGIFGNKWGNIVATNTAMIYIKGTTGESGGSNLKGCYWSEDGETWHRFLYELPARHATPVCAKDDGTRAYAVLGNFYNDSWTFIRTDLR